MRENIGLAEDYNEREGRLHPTVWEVDVILGDIIVSRDFLVYYKPLKPDCYLAKAFAAWCGVALTSNFFYLISFASQSLQMYYDTVRLQLAAAEEPGLLI